MSTKINGTVTFVTPKNATPAFGLITPLEPLAGFSGVSIRFELSLAPKGIERGDSVEVDYKTHGSKIIATAINKS